MAQHEQGHAGESYRVFLEVTDLLFFQDDTSKKRIYSYTLKLYSLYCYFALYCPLKLLVRYTRACIHIYWNIFCCDPYRPESTGSTTEEVTWRLCFIMLSVTGPRDARHGSDTMTLHNFLWLWPLRKPLSCEKPLGKVCWVKPREIRKAKAEIGLLRQVSLTV